MIEKYSLAKQRANEMQNRRELSNSIKRIYTGRMITTGENTDIEPDSLDEVYAILPELTTFARLTAPTVLFFSKHILHDPERESMPYKGGTPDISYNDLFKTMKDANKKDYRNRPDVQIFDADGPVKK